MDTLAVVLLVVAAATTVSTGVLAVLLAGSRRRVRVLRARLDHTHHSRSRSAARFALRTVVGTANRLREQGVTGFLASSIEEFTGIAIADRSEIAKVAAPDGTVTVFFSDIVDSTALNERLGDDGWVTLLAAHDKVVRHHVKRHHGHIVKSQGDGFMIVFGEPAHAARAASEIQVALAGRRGRVLRRTPIEVRMGMHTGTAIERDGDYFGRNVAMAARVAGVADGGEVLLSDEVRERLGDEFACTDLGEAELKGFPGAHRLWELDWS